MKAVKSRVLSLGLLIAWSFPLHAQTASSAIVLGRIIDSSGAVVPGAQVTLRNTATNAARQQRSNNVGQYVLSAVPPGSYILMVTKPGFETATLPEFQLDVNRSYAMFPSPLARSRKPSR